MKRESKRAQTLTVLTLVIVPALFLAGCPSAGDDGTATGDETPSYWATVLTADTTETPREIVPTQDGYLLVGERTDDQTGAKEIWAVMLNREGSVVWEKMYSASGSGEEQDLLLLKITSGGAVSWAHAVDLDLDASDGANDEPFTVYDLSKDLGGNVLLGGTANLGNGEDPVLFEIDTGGNLIQADSVAYPDFQDGSQLGNARTTQAADGDLDCGRRGCPEEGSISPSPAG